MTLPPQALAVLELHVPTGAEWASLAFAYLLGSVPFGWLLARMRGIDLRTVGSGNIGATNTGRALGRRLGLVAFGLDLCKGIVPVAVLAPALATEPERTSSLAALSGAMGAVGHCFPITLRFRGGKAVATWCGAIVAESPPVFLVGGAVWLTALFTLRFVGLASTLMAAAFAAVFAWRDGLGSAWSVVAAAMAVLIAVRHRANIARMASGTEPRFGRRPEESAESNAEENAHA